MADDRSGDAGPGAQLLRLGFIRTLQTSPHSQRGVDGAPTPRLSAQRRLLRRPRVAHSGVAAPALPGRSGGWGHAGRGRPQPATGCGAVRHGVPATQKKPGSKSAHPALRVLALPSRGSRTPLVGSLLLFLPAPPSSGPRDTLSSPCLIIARDDRRWRGGEAGAAGAPLRPAPDFLRTRRRSGNCS